MKSLEKTELIKWVAIKETIESNSVEKLHVKIVTQIPHQGCGI